MMRVPDNTCDCGSALQVQAGDEGKNPAEDEVGLVCTGCAQTFVTCHPNAQTRPGTIDISDTPFGRTVLGLVDFYSPGGEG